MSKGYHNTESRKKILEDNTIRKWYFDACMLEDMNTFGIFYKLHGQGIKSIISHLSLGEAMGNCMANGEEALTAYLELIHKINQDYCVIVGNDDLEEQFKKVKEMGRLSMTDSIHLATSLKYHCEKLLTKDCDLKDINKSKVKELGLKFNILNFLIDKQ